MIAVLYKIFLGFSLSALHYNSLFWLAYCETVCVCVCVCVCVSIVPMQPDSHYAIVERHSRRDNNRPNNATFP